MSDIKVDSKGRILLPSDIRKLLSIQLGDFLHVSVSSNKLILEKTADPFKKLDDLIGSVSFDVSKRKNIESLAIDLVNRHE